MLRPGGYFVWSATPVYQKLEEDVQIWKGIYIKTHFLFLYIFSCYIFFIKSDFVKLKYNLLFSRNDCADNFNVLGACDDQER